MCLRNSIENIHLIELSRVKIHTHTHIYVYTTQVKKKNERQRCRRRRRRKRAWNQRNGIVSIYGITIKLGLTSGECEKGRTRKISKTLYATRVKENEIWEKNNSNRKWRKKYKKHSIRRIKAKLIAKWKRKKFQILGFIFFFCNSNALYTNFTTVENWVVLLGLLSSLPYTMETYLFPLDRDSRKPERIFFTQ